MSTLPVRLVLLAAAISGAVLRPFRIPAWVAPVVVCLAGLASGALPRGRVVGWLSPLGGAVAFLLLAVPFSALLDQMGFFEQMSLALGGRRRVGLELWLLGAATTAVLNLDAAVVLLTPLFVRVARSRHLDETAFAFQPVLLASLASSLLPVSNLTNLVVAGRSDVHALAFLANLGLPTVAAVAVGYLRWRSVFAPGRPSPAAPSSGDPAILWRGGLAVAAVLAGFLVGPPLGLPLWAVVAVGDVALVAVTRSVPLRSVPLGTAAIAAALAVLAGAAAASVDIGPLLRATAGPLGTVADSVVAVLAADGSNNLPAILFLLPSAGPATGTTVWAILLGINVGPAFLVTGSLAGLLWMDAARQAGVQVRAADFSRRGLQVAGPAFVAATAVLVFQHLL